MYVEGWTALAPGEVTVPDDFVGPERDGMPHPIAAVAARALIAELPASGAAFEVAGGGKMFGVLVVEGDRGELGFLRAFSGMLGRRWIVPGFVPPLFDVDELDAFWPAGEAELDAMTRVIAELEGDARRSMIERRRARSRELWARIHASYRIADRRGRVRTLAELFAPSLPPSGAGDCVAPKLLGAAHRAGLRPVALAELWWGLRVGDRTHGSFHAPCDAKCGPILAHMLA